MPLFRVLNPNDIISWQIQSWIIGHYLLFRSIVFRFTMYLLLDNHWCSLISTFNYHLARTSSGNGATLFFSLFPFYLTSLEIWNAKCWVAGFLGGPFIVYFSASKCICHSCMIADTSLFHVETLSVTCFFFWMAVTRVLI